jgi:hypothetical protein
MFRGIFYFSGLPDYRKSIKTGGGAKNEVAPVVLPEV